ncbi:MAG: Ppx/GppA phosphatase family protein [Clostridia bacterium]|nr:Ppx/GppA phosphatase family protein [Clostridia bacterium]
MLGAIDIGTNSTRLLIAEVKEGKIKPVFTQLRTTRMGEGLIHTGELAEPAMERTCLALKEYKAKMEELKVERFQVVATSAVRDAVNREPFITRVFSETGFKVDVISGEEEAALSYEGVAGAMAITDSYVVVDIGGGSTEFIWAAPTGKVEAYSMQVGAVRMTESQAGIEEIRSLLEPALAKIRQGGITKLIGVGGTITTVAAIIQGLKVYDPDKVQGFVIDGDEVEALLGQLQAMTLAQRREVPGLQPQRADIICAGITILTQVLRGSDLNRITASEADILYGIIYGLSRL